jgi:hypothetical protein
MVSAQEESGDSMSGYDVAAVYAEHGAEGVRAGLAAARPLPGPNRDDGDGSTGFPTPLPPTAEEVLRKLSLTPPRRTYPTRFVQLNELLDGGLVSRTLLVIAAPPGSGKTALAGALGRDLAVGLTEWIPVLLCTTEIEGEEQAARLAAPELGVKPGDILAHRVSPSDAAEAVKGWPIYLQDLDGCSEADPLDAILAHAKGIQQATGRAPAIIVDYLQQLGAEHAEQRRVSIGLVANRLRRLARHLDVPAIGISSVSRAYYGSARRALENQEDPRAWLAAAKESGDIEFAAAAFAYLDTSGAVDAAGYSNARLIVAKSRGGRVGFVGLRFHGPTGMWSERAEAVEELGPTGRVTTDCERIIEALQARARRGQTAPTKEELRRGIEGMGDKRFQRAFASLMDAGTVVLKTEVRPNSAGRRREVNVVMETGKAGSQDMADMAPGGGEGRRG